MRNALLEVALGSCLLAAPAAAADLVVGHATLRAIATGVPAAGYFDIANASTAPVTLIGARSAACGSVMLHRSSKEGGMARMEEVMSVTVPPHGKISFAPGGYHLMCMDPAASLLKARTAGITLEFQNAPALTAAFTVTDALGHPH